MCLSCHQRLSDSTVEEQLLETLITKNFKDTNATSISHFSIAGFGLNGAIAQERAIKVLEEYILWKRNNSMRSDNDFFGQPSADLVQEQLEKVHKFNEISVKNNLTSDDIRDMFYHGQNVKDKETDIKDEETDIKDEEAELNTDETEAQKKTRNSERVSALFGNLENYSVDMVLTFGGNKSKENNSVSILNTLGFIGQQIQVGLVRISELINVVFSRIKCLFEKKEEEEPYKDRIY